MPDEFTANPAIISQQVSSQDHFVQIRADLLPDGRVRLQLIDPSILMKHEAVLSRAAWDTLITVGLRPEAQSWIQRWKADE